jgi:cholesterol transport system auxiliary component
MPSEWEKTGMHKGCRLLLSLSLNLVLLKGVWRLGLLALLAGSVTACLLPLGGQERPLHLHLFGLNESTVQDQAPAVGGGTGVVLVNVPQARAGVDTPRMAYLLRPYEVQYYANNQWADTPARMLAPLLVRALEQTGTWSAVVQMPHTVRGEYRVDSELLAAQQEFFQKPSLFRLTLRVQLVSLRDQRVLGTRGFEAIEPAPSENAYGAVLAANRALATLLDQVANWLTACIAEGKPRRC